MESAIQEVQVEEVRVSEARACQIVGELRYFDRWGFHGRLEGKMLGGAGSELLIGKDAIVIGDITGHWVEVQGLVEGTIKANKLVVRTNAQVKATLVVGALEVDPGANLECIISPLKEPSTV